LGIHETRCGVLSLKPNIFLPADFRACNTYGHDKQFLISEKYRKMAIKGKRKVRAPGNNGVPKSAMPARQASQ
jgi:hypothetical protein